MSMIILLLSVLASLRVAPVTLAQEAEVTSVGGVSSSENYIMVLGQNDGTDDEPELEMVQLARNPSPYGQVLASSTGMYTDNFATQSATGVTTEVQMTIDSLYVALDNLSPGILVNGESQIVVNSNIPTGYSLYVAQDMPLHLDESEIRLLTEGLRPHPRELIYGTDGDNNLCEGQDNRCKYTTDTNGDTWTNQDVAGFGYTVIGEDARDVFGGGTLYKSFASMVDDEPAQRIAGKEWTEQVLSNRVTTVRYQVGARPENEAGLYHNNIKYTLVPNY